MSSFPDMPPIPAEPSIGQLVKSLVADMGTLVRTEINHARAEVGSNVGKMGSAATFVAIGGVLLLASLVTLLAAFVAWLTPVVGSTGWAAFIVAAVVGGIGAALALSGVNRLKATSIAPTRTIASVKQDADVIRGNA